VSDLRRAIDRMVEDAIRRILPEVMNEVLVATIARGTAGVVAEERPRRKPPKRQQQRRAPVREQRTAVPQRGRKAPPKRKVDLSDLLDESVGAEFYENPRAVYTDEPNPAEVPPSQDTNRIRDLPPDLQELAEGMDLDDDNGEMWGADEHDSGLAAPSAPEIRNISEAARAAGVDFSRMKAVIGRTATRKPDADDLKARTQFEQARLNRMRVQLNDGKPIE
jgi:hypothetical protein